jgi:hypothetical protein
VDLATLETRLSVDEGRLAVDLSELESPRLCAFLEPLLAGRTIVDLARVEPFSVAPDSVTIRGVGRSDPFVDMAVVVVFRLAEDRIGELDVEITATATDGWELARAFPEIVRTPFARLAFVRRGPEPAAVLRLSSRGGDEARGLWLTGNAAPVFFSVLSFLAREEDHYALRGPLDIRYVDDPLFYPRGAPREGPPVTLPGFNLRFELSPPERPLLPVRFVDIEGELASTPRYDTAYNGWRLDSSV